MLEDANVDLALLGAVPFTARMKSLPPGLSESDRCDAADGYAARMAELFHQSAKPLCVVVDAGPLYEPLPRGPGLFFGAPTRLRPRLRPSLYVAAPPRAA